MGTKQRGKGKRGLAVLVALERKWHAHALADGPRSASPHTLVPTPTYSPKKILTSPVTRPAIESELNSLETTRFELNPH